MTAVTSRRDDQPLVSVVTPFYNTAEYLHECIESVLAQTYGNWEYVLVNNCSTDGSREIAAEYLERDERIRLIDNEHLLGQVDNYNRSLQHISPQSDYCKMVQADDWIFPECLRRMVEIGERYPSVSVIGAYGMFGDFIYLAGLPYPSWCIPGADACRKLLLERIYVFGSPTSLMFRSQRIRDREPFFAPDSPVEDAEISFELLEDSDFGFVHEVLTFTRTENDSITKSTRSFNIMLLTEFLCCRKFGQRYLTEAEFAQRNRELTAEYFTYLGESVLRRRSADFWSFHLDALAAIDERFSGLRKLKYTTLALLDLCLNPKMTLERLRRL